MGLTPASARWQLELQVEGAQQLLMRQTLQVPDSAAVTMTRRWATREQASLLQLIADDALLLQSDRWELRDRGFIAARNRYCSNKSQISKEEYLAVQSIGLRDMLNVRSLSAADPALLQLADYLGSGGDMMLSVKYMPPLDAGAMDAGISTWASRADIVLQHNGRQSRIALAGRPVEVVKSGNEPGAATPWTSQFNERLKDIIKNPFADTIEPRPQTNQAAAKSGASEIDKLREATGTSVVALERTRGGEAAQPILEQVTGYDALGDLIGQTVMVYTHSLPPREMEVEFIDISGIINVKYRVGSGYVAHALRPDEFIRAEVIPK